METSILKPGIPVALCSDHAGYQTKEAVKQWLEGQGIAYKDFGTYNEDSCDYVKQWLEAQGIAYKDFGTYNEDSCDYPDFAHLCAAAVEQGECYPGIAVCGSGEGINITLNKHQGVRSALCWRLAVARLARQHNDANVLCRAALSPTRRPSPWSRPS